MWEVYVIAIPSIFALSANLPHTLVNDEII